MKAILTMIKQNGNKTENERLLFDTEKSKEICEVKNVHGFVVEKIYLSPGGIIFSKIFSKITNQEKLKVQDQELAKEYIAEHHPETYIEIFGEVKRA